MSDTLVEKATLTKPNEFHFGDWEHTSLVYTTGDTHLLVNICGPDDTLWLRCTDILKDPIKDNHFLLMSVSRIEGVPYIRNIGGVFDVALSTVSVHKDNILEWHAGVLPPVKEPELLTEEEVETALEDAADRLQESQEITSTKASPAFQPDDNGIVEESDIPVVFSRKGQDPHEARILESMEEVRDRKISEQLPVVTREDETTQPTGGAGASQQFRREEPTVSVSQ